MHLTNMEMEYANARQKSVTPSSVCPLGPSGVKYSAVKYSAVKMFVDPLNFDYPYGWS